MKIEYLYILVVLMQFSLAFWWTKAILDERVPPWWLLVFSLYLMGIRRCSEYMEILSLNQGLSLDNYFSFLIVISITLGMFSVKNSLEEFTSERKRKLNTLQLVFESLVGGSWELHVTSQKVTFSKDYAKLLGFELSELGDFRESWISLVHPEDLPSVFKEAEEFINGEKPFYLREYRLRKKSGDYIWVNDSALVIESEKGKPSRILGLTIDITDKRRDRELATTLNSLKGVLTNLELGNCIWETGPDLISWDKKSQEIFGLPDNFKAVDFLPYVHPQDVHFFSFFSNLKNGIADTCTYRFLKDKQYRWIRVIASKIGESPQTGIVISAISADVTQQVENMNLLEERQKALESKNTELQNFLHVASHDLQEPLRKIVYYCKKIQDSQNAPEKQSDYLNWTIESTVRMQTLLLDLLDYTRAGRPLNISTFRLSDILGITHATLLSQIEEKNGILSLISDVIIQGDRSQWERLIQNLVSNALKYQDGPNPPLIKISGTDDAEWTIITIQDNGIGVPWEYRDRIFEPFRRLHTQAKYSGTGMGLALCRRIVEKHNGQITLSESTSSGSLFKIRIPRKHSNEFKNKDSH